MLSGSDELIGLELRRLPQLAAPVRGWERVEARLDAPVLPRARWLGSVGAMAASVCATGVALVWLTTRTTPDTPRVAAGVAGIEQLVERSQRLEAELRRLPARPAVERASTAAVIDELQSRIQLIDTQLAHDSARARDDNRQHSMWDERVRLLNSLVDVRYAEALRNSHYTIPTSGEI